jgi:hypothetical protein
MSKEKTIKEKVYAILEKNKDIGGKALLKEYKRRYSEDLNYRTALNYKTSFRKEHNLPPQRKVRKRRKMERYFKFLRKNPGKRYKRALEREFDISRGYAGVVLHSFLQQEDAERAEKYKWVLEPLREFVKEKCLTGSNYSIRKKTFLPAFNTYLKQAKLDTISQSKLTELMHILDYEDTIGYTGTVRYLGITLTLQGAKTLLSECDFRRFERAEKIKRIKGKENITGGEACKLICCKPAQTFLKKIGDKYFDKFSYQKIRKILIKVVEVCGMGRYIDPKIAVATSIYIFSQLYLDGKLSQEYVCGICKTNVRSLRQYVKRVQKHTEFKKDPTAEYNFSIKPIEV